MTYLKRSAGYSAQQGAVLIVSLVILLVITLLGTAAIQSTSLEFKMAKNVDERQRVFQSTEAALRRVENLLQSVPPTRAQLDSSVCEAGSADFQKSCFDNECNGGLCFWGSFTGTDTTDTCTVISGTPSPAATGGNPSTFPVWHSQHHLDVWNTAGKHQILPDIEGTSFKYIVEFQCFVDALSGFVQFNAGDGLYRITVLGDNANLQVMLQSTYGVEP